MSSSTSCGVGDHDNTSKPIHILCNEQNKRVFVCTENSHDYTVSVDSTSASLTLLNEAVDQELLEPFHLEANN